MVKLKGEQSPKSNPREKANCLSFLFFCWIYPILFKGWKRDLDTNDLYRPLSAHRSGMLGDKLSAAWEQQLTRGHGHKPSIMQAIVNVFGWKFAGVGLCMAAFELLLRMPQPIYLGGLIFYYNSPETLGGLKLAHLYAGALVVSNLLCFLIFHSCLLSQFHCGMKVRLAMCSMIYRKSLRLSKRAMGNTTAGHVVNLMSNDASRLDVCMMLYHYIWIAPLVTAIMSYFMYCEIGWSAFVGIVIVLLFIPLQGYLSKKISQYRSATAVKTDNRVRLMNEIIQGIQVIKMYAWERPFGKLVELARIDEIAVIRYASYVNSCMASFNMFSTRLSIFASLVVYALVGNVMTAENAFVITAYYNSIRILMGTLFPKAISQLAESFVTLKRIQEFLLFDEKNSHKSLEQYGLASKTDASIKTDTFKMIKEQSLTSTDSPVGIQISNVSAQWTGNTSATDDLTLNDISVNIQPGQLVAIIGPVGAGKSSLFQAILGELPIQSGTINVNRASISYAAQEPWIFSGTIEANILFGQEMNRHRYAEVVKNCSLERDFAQFPQGDQTVVGERGLFLSGGQKARVSLARACYRRAAIYLLDDPLSAVDSKVGKHLFDQCVRGLLRDRIVLLVTHQLQFLENVDKIMIFNRGTVEAIGSYQLLQASGLDFAKLLAKPAIDEDEQDDDDDGGQLNRLKSIRHSKRVPNNDGQKEDVADEDAADNGMLVTEQTIQGSVQWSEYGNYIKAGGGFWVGFSILILFAITQFTASAGDFFLLFWIVQNNDRETVSNDFVEKEQMNDEQFSYIYIFTGITVATIVITLSRSFLFFNVAMKASQKLHNAMYQGIVRASMYFFNTNPTGRILNRFSKDMGQIDELLPATMMEFLQVAMQICATFIIVAIINYWLIIPTAVIFMVFYYLQMFYMKSAQSFKRMDATSRSPIYSQLGTSLVGLSTIRAFNAEQLLVKEFDTLQDHNSSPFYISMAASRAFGLWVDLACVCYLTIVMVSMFFMGATGAIVGLTITQAMGMTGWVQWGVRQLCDVESAMTSVERVTEYQTVDPEEPVDAAAESPPTNWPADGAVQFDRVSMRYFPDPSADFVLKELHFAVQPREKIGIVGRTGAGKSSLINALFRLSYNVGGGIRIDQLDTGAMRLEDLRRKISIIPQEPVLFSGTIRYNLDPFREYSDDRLWTALEEVKLKAIFGEMSGGLESHVQEGGCNFSVGQRQLVCLARALLRQNRVLVMDEATANVDPQTDALIQATIREKFANCTIFTIAHRLHTIMDSDKVLVMDAGRVVEYGSPFELLTTTASESKMFQKMVMELGRSTFDSLLETARRSAEDRGRST